MIFLVKVINRADCNVNVKAKQLGFSLTNVINRADCNVNIPILDVSNVLNVVINRADCNVNLLEKENQELSKIGY